MRRLFAGLAEVEHCRWFRRFVLLHASTVPQNQHNTIHKTTNACAVITPAPYPSAASRLSCRVRCRQVSSHRLSCRVRCRQVSSQAVPSCDLYTDLVLQNRGLPSVVRFADKKQYVNFSAFPVGASKWRTLLFCIPAYKASPKPRDLPRPFRVISPGFILSLSLTRACHFQRIGRESQAGSA